MYDDEEVICADRAVIIMYPYGRRAGELQGWLKDVPPVA